MPAWSQESTTDKIHDFCGLKHAVPDWPEGIAMLVYPGMTALDLVGPQQVFGYVMGTRVRLVSKTNVPVLTDTQQAIDPKFTDIR